MTSKAINSLNYGYNKKSFIIDYFGLQTPHRVKLMNIGWNSGWSFALIPSTCYVRSYICIILRCYSKLSNHQSHSVHYVYKYHSLLKPPPYVWNILDKEPINLVTNLVAIKSTSFKTHLFSLPDCADGTCRETTKHLVWKSISYYLQTKISVQVCTSKLTIVDTPKIFHTERRLLRKNFEKFSRVASLTLVVGFLWSFIVFFIILQCFCSFYS